MLIHVCFWCVALVIYKKDECMCDGWGYTLGILQDLHSMHTVLFIRPLQIDIHPLSINLDQDFSSGPALRRPLLHRCFPVTQG